MKPDFQLIFLCIVNTLQKPLEMNASSRVLLEFRIATTVFVQAKADPSNPFQKNIESNVFRCFYIVILLDLARF